MPRQVTFRNVFKLFAYSYNQHIKQDSIILSWNVLKSIIDKKLCRRYIHNVRKRTVDGFVPDRTDLAIIDQLHRDGRASWAYIASEVGVSAATVRRRYERMHADGMLRVIGATDVVRLGVGAPLYLRFTSVIRDLDVLVRNLTASENVRFFATVLGSFDVVAEVVLPQLEDLPPLVKRLVENTSADADSMLITHAFVSNQDWMPPSMSKVATSAIKSLPPNTDFRHALSMAEVELLHRLMKDGRVSVADIASQIRKSESTVSRMIDTLSDDGVLSFRVLVEPQMLGYKLEVLGWFEVEPSQVRAVAMRLAKEPCAKYISSTTGKSNLSGQFVFKNKYELSVFTTEVLGQVRGIKTIDISVQVETHKRVWTNLIDGKYVSNGQPFDIRPYVDQRLLRV